MRKIKTFRDIKGPWKFEPDYLEWIDDITGYKCLIKREMNSYHLNGYVNIPKNHPMCGFYQYDDFYLEDISDSCHGGITYAEDQIDGAWTYGFDCAHAYDLAPLDLLRQGKTSYDYTTSSARDVYRNMDYVIDNCLALAKSLKEKE